MEAGRSYLFVTWEGGGNVPAVLGAARRLVARGHRVRVLSEPCLAEAIAGIGAEFVPFTRHFTRTDRRQTILDDAVAGSQVAALKRSFEVILFGPARITAEETQAAILAAPTDVVVVDHLMPGALVAAEAAGISRVVLFHAPEYLPGPGRPAAGPGFLPSTNLLGRARDKVFTAMFHKLVAGYLEPFNDARRALALEPLASAKELVAQYHRADLRLIQTSAAFDFPIDPAPGNVRYVGPVLDDPDWTPEPQAEWTSLWQPGDERPLVVASLSSTYQDQRPVLERIIVALGTLPVRGLVTVGPALSVDFDTTPENVRVVPSLAHSAVFPRTAAVITHGGHGTVMRALVNGVPLLCLPMGRDQNDNAARVVVRGAGLRLKQAAPPKAIAASVGRLLNEPAFATAAAKLGRAISHDVAAQRLVAELEGVGRRPGARAA